MNLYESVIVNLLFILFPLILYLFYIAYNRNLGKEENDLYLDVALLTSFYFTIRYGMEPITLILNIPLLIAYLKKRYLIIISASIVIIWHSVQLGSNIYLIVMKYLCYFIVYLIFKKKKYPILYFIIFFILLKTFSYMMIVHEGSYLKNVMFCFIFYVVTFFTLYLFKKGEDILKFYMNVKELEQEKQIRTSLFKITHEIKNPIAVCKGYLDMFDVNNVEHSKKYVPIMKEEINRTLVLLQDFLSMTKIKIEKEVLDINLLLEEVINQFLPIFKEKGISIEMGLFDDEVYIMGDYNRLSQVFINILKNSMEAFEREGDFKISITTDLKKSHVQIKLCDNGCGMSKEVLDKIAEPFYTTKQNGTGLGISLSFEIIKAHGGKIQYSSEVGKGTTIVILLPLLEE